MKRLVAIFVFAGLLAGGWGLMQYSAVRAAEATSGQGDLRFRVLYRSDHLPLEAQKVLQAAHGGFAVDRRPGKGETYFALPGAGIVQISADLKSTRMMDTDAAMRDTNLHNTTLWESSGNFFLSFPANQANKVFTTDLNGRLVNTLDAPTATTDLGNATANEYFRAGEPFIPTDVEHLGGLLYVTTGYSKLDYVLTARVAGTNPFRAAWNNLAFGGKGDGVGQFQTGHGITVPPGGGRIDVADRPNAEIDRFTPEGKYLSTLNLPAGSFSCDIDYLGNRAVVGSLHGPDREKGAPIYVLENDKVVSTVMCKEELGLENFQHIHNAVLRDVGGKLYIIAQAWNPGDFAILEQVTN